MRPSGIAPLVIGAAVTVATNLAQLGVQEWRLEREAARAAAKTEKVGAKSASRLSKLHGCREGYNEAVAVLAAELAECREER